jgi:D-alanyl-D-alanine carboxypeptidase (penicillin-binding protein 5/6)
MNIKKISAAVLLLTVAFLFSSTGLFASGVPIPGPPSISAKSYILIDHDTGTIIAEHDADKSYDPASITKLMTAYVIYDALKKGDISVSDQVTISEKAWRAIGSRMFIEVNTQVSVDDLLKGMIIQSGNDASIALAEHVAGSEGAFADLMNSTAEKLGMHGSHFVNVTGLTSEQHYMTARDIAILSQAIIRDFPDDYKRYAVKEFTYNGITQQNRNKLLWRDESVDGLKTGHTDAAKYCLAASAKREGMRLISAVMGAPSVDARTTNSQALLNYGFRFYETSRLYSAQQELISKRVWYGEGKEVKLGIKEDVVVTIPRGRHKDLEPYIEVATLLEAPLQKNQVVGKVNVKLDGEIYQQIDLVALHEVKEGSLIRKLTDFFMSYFE